MIIEGDNVVDMDYISNMLRCARIADMEVEVVWSFSNAIRSGSSIPEAVEFALNEWDI